jgi:hypothetical protein
VGKLVLVGLAIFLAVPSASADPRARIVLVNLNAPDVGLNDPTPVVPVGGNPMTTLGGQRMFALQHAANIWASQLRSHPAVRIQIAFIPRPCLVNAAVVASAGPMWLDLNFKHAPVADTWYHGALANKLSKKEIAPEIDEIQALFNINLGSSTGGSNPALPDGGPCFAGSPFYYGIDGNEGNGVDLVATALHEFAHGLGFSQFANVNPASVEPESEPGSLFFGAPDVFNRQLLDTTTGLTWDTMTNGQRLASSVNNWNVVWAGEHVTAEVPNRLALGVAGLRINAPFELGTFLQVGAAAFGPPLGSPGTVGDVAIGIDASNAAGPSSTDGCSPIQNAALIAGRLGMVDRGTCGFAVKAKNLQDAGARGVIIANNAPGPAPGLGGVDPTVTIPTVSVSLADATRIKTQLAAGVTVNGIILFDVTRRAGANDAGLALIHAPNPVQLGSSISHWDPVGSPNLLMEPAINKDLTHALDLTYPLLLDLGWLDEENRD